MTADVKDFNGNQLNPGDIVVFTDKHRAMKFGVVNDKVSRVHAAVTDIGGESLASYRVMRVDVTAESIGGKAPELQKTFRAYATVKKAEIVKRGNSFVAAVQKSGLAEDCYMTDYAHDNVRPMIRVVVTNDAATPAVTALAAENGLAIIWDGSGKCYGLAYPVSQNEKTEPVVDARAVVLEKLNAGDIDGAWLLFLEQPNKEHYRFAGAAWAEETAASDGYYYSLRDYLTPERHQEIDIEDINEMFCNTIIGSDTTSASNNAGWQQRVITDEVLRMWKKGLILCNFGSGTHDW